MNAIDAARLIALDWGTSSLRAFLLGDQGIVLEQRAAPLGVMHVPPGGFPDAFKQVAGDWRRAAPGLPAIASGMVGSTQGWREAPYCEGAAGPAQMAAGLLEIPLEDGGSVHIVPGISIDGPRPEVMRGEETQIFGALALRPALRDGVRLLLPGTHSKWVDLSDGCIAGFQTFMTGELFAILRDHSILGRFAREGAARTLSDEAAFDDGVASARESKDGIAPLLFSARARVLLGALPGSASLDYLSGLLIGDELRCALAMSTPRIAMIGEAGLGARYRRALAGFGIYDVPEIDGAAPAGLWCIASEAGLIGTVHI